MSKCAMNESATRISVLCKAWKQLPDKVVARDLMASHRHALTFVLTQSQRRSTCQARAKGTVEPDVAGRKWQNEEGLEAVFVGVLLF